MEKHLENFRPIGNRILLDVIKEEEITASGLVIASTITEEKQEKYTDRAHILKIGQKVPEVQVGEVCVFNVHSGIPIKFDDKVYLLVTEDSIFGILE